MKIHKVNPDRTFGQFGSLQRSCCNVSNTMTQTIENHIQYFAFDNEHQLLSLIFFSENAFLPAETSCICVETITLRVKI